MYVSVVCPCVIIHDHFTDMDDDNSMASYCCISAA